ncbi:hypothetical protein ERL59_20250 [Chengkuizengella sp. YPA3-1-1]|uniref:Uncharacterized protein n=1 Tax=Chengkuizengella marina TaxID=2507566 RepID=A0A6N9Q999_9BACL|nr:hypothetical protein [Chengkuizengella marina]
MWTSQKILDGKNLDYFLHVGNNSNTKLKFVLVGFLDWNQIPLNSNSQKVFYGELKPKHRGIIKGEIEYNKINDRSNFTVIFLPNAFSILNNSYGKEYANEASFRLGIYKSKEENS